MRPIWFLPCRTVNSGGAVNTAIRPMKWRRRKRRSASGPMNSIHSDGPCQRFGTKTGERGELLRSLVLIAVGIAVASGIL